MALSFQQADILEIIAYRASKGLDLSLGCINTRELNKAIKEMKEVYDDEQSKLHEGVEDDNEDLYPYG